MAETSLKPCPFCGGGETNIDVRRLSPTMKGQGAIVSVTVRHHCPKIEGQPTGLNVSMHGRDEQSAIAAWNRRATDPAVAELVEAGQSLVDEIRESGTHQSYKALASAIAKHAAKP